MEKVYMAKRRHPSCSIKVTTPFKEHLMEVPCTTKENKKKRTSTVKPPRSRKRKKLQVPYPFPDPLSRNLPFLSNSP
ncbi:hypothetical protein CDAR_198221 [Caerostris darwini]|uniref:Uncharacterized protein n=1 Tax=Caerostris darwini TaxID=1538125 RepID=A0AAV4RMK7_9ARAC|nr:hypothetical protein CDAR_198221 [Caerostris darwini]